MAIRDVFKISRKTFFNPSAWLDMDALREYNSTIFDSIRGLFTAVPGEARKETFAEAMKRQKVTDAQLKETENAYFIYSIAFLVLGILMLIFGFYLLFGHHTFHGWILALASAAFLFAQSFRFSFWHFQIKFRKLGCTFEEWKRGKPFDKEPMA